MAWRSKSVSQRPFISWTGIHSPWTGKTVKDVWNDQSHLESREDRLQGVFLGVAETIVALAIFFFSVSFYCIVLRHFVVNTAIRQLHISHN